MPTGLLELSKSKHQLPALVALDTNIIILAFVTPKAPLHANAMAIVQQIQARGSIGVLMPRAVNELLHFLITLHYKQEVPNHTALINQYRRHREAEWVTLFKQRPQFVRHVATTFNQLVTSLSQYGIIVFSPDDMLPCEQESIDKLIADHVVRYELDTTDAEMLLELDRSGIDSIASLDGDLRRAQTGFQVLIW